jgi:hypothetical protein
MITGYNTDVRYREKVLHVQTEDKGLGNPFIESVVYHGGQVVAAKRASYSDLVRQGVGNDAISARMDHQHRMMIAAIRAGRLDQKLREVLGPDALGSEDGATVVAPPPEAAAPLLDASRSEASPTLDQVILDYLTSEAQQDQLELALESNGLGLGVSCRVQLRATSTRSGLPVAGAQVLIKMISTVKEPLLLGQGTTDHDGRLALDLAIPPLTRGTAAIIVTASSLIGSAELQQVL